MDLVLGVEEDCLGEEEFKLFEDKLPRDVGDL